MNTVMIFFLIGMTIATVHITNANLPLLTDRHPSARVEPVAAVISPDREK